MSALKYTQSGDIFVGSPAGSSPSPSTSTEVFSREFLGTPVEPVPPKNGKIFTKKRGRPPSTTSGSRRGRPPSTNAASKKRRTKVQAYERQEERLKGGFIISDSDDYTGKEDSSDAEAQAMLSIASDSDSGSHDSDASDVFHVESILDDYVQEDGVQRYLIKWKGYDSSENTWEPEDVSMLSAKPTPHSHARTQNLNCPAILENYRKLKNPARRANARVAFRNALNEVGDGKKPKVQTVHSGVRTVESAAKHSGSSTDDDNVPLRNSLSAIKVPNLKVKLKRAVVTTAQPEKLNIKGDMDLKEEVTVEGSSGLVAGHRTTEATEERDLQSGEEGDGEMEVAQRKAKVTKSKSDTQVLASVYDAKATTSTTDSTVVNGKNNSNAGGIRGVKLKESATPNDPNGSSLKTGTKKTSNKNESHVGNNSSHRPSPEPSTSKKMITPLSNPAFNIPSPVKAPEYKPASRKLYSYKPISSAPPAPTAPTAPALAKENTSTESHISAVSRKPLSASPTGPASAISSTHPSANRSMISPRQREALDRPPAMSKAVDALAGSTSTESSDVSVPHDSTPEVDPNAARLERRALLEMRLTNRTSGLQAAKKQFQLKQRLANTFRNEASNTPPLPGDKVAKNTAAPASNHKAHKVNTGQSYNDIRGSPSTYLPVDQEPPGALNSSSFQDPLPGGNSLEQPGDYVEIAPALPSQADGVNGPLDLERIDSPVSMRDNSFTPDYAVSPVSDIDYSQVPQVKPYEPPGLLSKDPRDFDPRLGRGTYDYAVPLAVRLPLENYAEQLPSSMWSLPVSLENLPLQIPLDVRPPTLAPTSRSNTPNTPEYQVSLPFPGPNSYHDIQSDADNLSHLMTIDTAPNT